ncbi:ABC transporter ATP-binding protein [Peribacillus kribbensis]|uniref:ABC transporter ATP-binding protein n=1 Tax=Peribacillus kribbensis TaxID=356658 RepID=UPI0003F63850|nr:ABC transporter ATP-binding protein [Peribacillus kribbensis]
MDISVSVKQLTKKYKLYEDKWGPIKEVVTKKKLHKEFLALHDVSIDFPKGEAIGVLGKNGSGKSTLLKIITGIADPSSGTVDVNGTLVFLDVSSGIDPELSGYENIFMKGVLLGYSREQMLEKVDEIIEFSELGEFISQPVKNYSSGMRAKLGFAISVNVDPDILIVDEALAVGDSMFREKCMNKMNEFKEQGKTIIFVSHDKNAVENFCSKAAWINQGELIAFGDSKQIGSIYNEFMSGRKKLDEIKSSLEFIHSIENVSPEAGESGLSIGLEGYLYSSAPDFKGSYELVVKDTRTGEAIAKPLALSSYKGDSSLPDEKKDTSGFRISIDEQDFSGFLKPGKYSFLVRYKEEHKEGEFPLWAGNLDLNITEDMKSRYINKIKVENNTLALLVENVDKVQEQVNKIWFEEGTLNLEGVCFVRGYEVGSPEDAGVTLHVVNLESFKEEMYPVELRETDEITENPSFNPQGKNYNFAGFRAGISLDHLRPGRYEYRMTYQMKNKPGHELLIPVWASKRQEYPSEPFLWKDREIDIQTSTKYLRMTVK